MNNSIITIMEKNIVIADLEDTAESIIEILDSHKLSCVPIVDSSGNCFGVISATDFIHFYHEHINPKAVRAWEICTHKIIEVSPDISMVEASELMIRNKIHHLVVIEAGKIIGIISSIDLLREYMANKIAV